MVASSMARDELREASKLLDEAVSDVEEPDARDRLREQAAQLDQLATRDQGPDHGRLDRHQHALRTIKTDAPEVADTVDEANELINAYRETIEGV